MQPGHGFPAGTRRSWTGCTQGYTRLRGGGKMHEEVRVRQEKGVRSVLAVKVVSQPHLL